MRTTIYEGFSCLGVTLRRHPTRPAFGGSVMKGKTVVWTIGLALLVVVGYDYYKQRSGR